MSVLSSTPLASSQRSSASYDVADHFDTAHFVSKLEQEGLTRIQAEGIIGTLEEVIEQSIDNMQRNLVTRAEQDKVRSVSQE